MVCIPLDEVLIGLWFVFPRMTPWLDFGLYSIGMDDAIVVLFCIP